MGGRSEKKVCVSSIATGELVVTLQDNDLDERERMPTLIATMYAVETTADSFGISSSLSSSSTDVSGILGNDSEKMDYDIHIAVCCGKNSDYSSMTLYVWSLSGDLIRKFTLSNVALSNGLASNGLVPNGTY